MGADLFAAVPQHELRLAGRRRTFTRGEVVFHRDDPGDSLHHVIAGRFASRVTTPVGDVVTLAVHGPGTVFGLLAVLQQEGRRSATIVALERSETIAVARSTFERLRAQYPAIAGATAALLVEMLETTNERLVEALYTPVATRVRARLAELARAYARPGETEVTIPLSQEELAGLAGTTRETVNRILREEARHGRLTIARGRVTLRDAPR